MAARLSKKYLTQPGAEFRPGPITITKERLPNLSTQSMHDAKDKFPQNWYLRHSEQVKGPFRLGQIRNFVLIGRAHLDDEVSADKLTWVQLKTYPEMIPKEMSEPLSAEGEHRLVQARRHQDERRGERRLELGVIAERDRRFTDRRENNSPDARPIRAQHQSPSQAYQARTSYLLPAFGFSILVFGLLAAVVYHYSTAHPAVAPVSLCKTIAAPRVNWSNCALEGLNAAMQNLEAAELQNSNLRGADLHGANLLNANLRYANLSTANLSYTDLRYANLFGAGLRNADLTNAHLDFADLSYADLSGAKIGGARLVNIRLDKALWIDGRRCAIGSVGQCL